jgi:hypothetical protein
MYHYPQMQQRFFLFLFLVIFSSATCSAQIKDSLFRITGYVDAYYAYYTDSVGKDEFQKFPSVSPRSQQFGLNTAQINLQYDAEKVRALVVLHYGDIAGSAWSSTFNNIMEAHAGVKLGKKFWIDAGFFRTHFGTEGLLPKENICNSIAINTFYEPYFESGVRLNYNPNDKIAIYIYALNGYNTFIENNDQKSFGALVTYAFNEKTGIGYSNYTGDDSPESATGSHLRIHNNLFYNYQGKKLKLQLGGDFCSQQNSDTTGTKSATMFSGIVSAKFAFNGKWSLYGREEFFNDPQGYMSTIIVDSKNQQTGYVLSGTTLGAEFIPIANSYIRLEGRQLLMDKNQEIFYWEETARNYRFEIMMNLGISF